MKNINKLKSLALAALVSYLPFFLLMTYSFFTEGIRILGYIEILVYLLLGPIGLVMLDPKILIFEMGSSSPNYLSILFLIGMLISLVVGTWKFEQSKFYKGVFIVGCLIWFFQGLVAVGIHYLTV